MRSIANAFELVAVSQESRVFQTSEFWKRNCPILTRRRRSFIIIIVIMNSTTRRNHYRNIVATVNLDCKLDLKTIAFHARNVEYNPKVRRRFRRFRFRRRRARCAIHLFTFCVFLLPCGRRERKERTSRRNGTLTNIYAL